MLNKFIETFHDNIIGNKCFTIQIFWGNFNFIYISSELLIISFIVNEQFSKIPSESPWVETVLDAPGFFLVY